MSPRAQSIVLIFLGAAAVRIVVLGQHVRYVKPALGPFVLAAGVVLVAAGAYLLTHSLRGKASHDHDHGHDHGPSHVVGWLLLLPALGLTMFVPPALGAFAAGQSGTALSQQAPANTLPPLPQTNPAPLRLLDYASRAVTDEGATLRGRSVVVRGFLAKGADHELYLARMMITCCAADARPIKIGLDGTLPAGLHADQWVQVTGTHTARIGKDPVNGGVIPYLTVTDMRHISEPDPPYE